MPTENAQLRNDPVPSPRPESLELQKRLEALESILDHIQLLRSLLASFEMYDPSIQALIARNASVYIKIHQASEPASLPQERSLERLHALNKLKDRRTDDSFAGFADKRSRIYLQLFEQSAETARQLSMVQEILALIVKDIRDASPTATTTVVTRNPELLRTAFHALVNHLDDARQQYLNKLEDPHHIINWIDTTLKSYVLKTVNAT